jgi:hypothetical protein
MNTRNADGRSHGSSVKVLWVACVLTIVGLTGCGRWSQRVFERTAGYPSPDGLSETVVLHETPRGFTGNPFATWILVRAKGTRNQEEDVVLAVDTRASVDVQWLGSRAVYVKLRASRTVRPLFYGKKGGVDIRVDLVEPSGNRRLVDFSPPDHAR